MKKNIIFEEEVYGEPSLYEYIRKEVLPYVPYYTMEDLKSSCDIELRSYGFTHDTGFEVIIKEHNELRNGHGWSNLDKRYLEEMEFQRERWRIAEEYSYHGM